MAVESKKSQALKGAFITGALGTGLLASCCGIPLLLGAIGLGATGATLLISTWRYPLLVFCLLSTIASGLFLFRRSSAVCETGCSEHALRRTRRLVVGGVAASILLGGAGILLANPVHEQIQSAPSVVISPRIAQVEIPVRGMSCAGCAAPIKAALAQVAPIQQFDVDISHGLVRFAVNAAQIEMTSFRRAIESLGYATDEPRLVAR